MEFIVNDVKYYAKELARKYHNGTLSKEESDAIKVVVLVCGVISILVWCAVFPFLFLIYINGWNTDVFWMLVLMVCCFMVIQGVFDVL